MSELKVLIEFVIAVVSAYFLTRIEIVKLQKDVTSFQLRCTTLEDTLQQHENEMKKDLKEIIGMLHQLQLKILETQNFRRHEP